MKRIIVQKTKREEGGFAMLFAVLVASVLLSIGLSIFNLTVKELTLSASGRESQFAFYAADTGAECAFYWDIKGGTDVFATSSAARTPVPSNPDCVDSYSPALTQTIDINTHPAYTLKKADGSTVSYNPGTNSNWAVTQFSIDIPKSNPQYCAIVTVVKDSSSGILVTTIDSRGYNTPCSDTTSPNRLERALKVTY